MSGGDAEHDNEEDAVEADEPTSAWSISSSSDSSLLLLLLLLAFWFACELFSSDLVSLPLLLLFDFRFMLRLELIEDEESDDKGLFLPLLLAVLFELPSAKSM